MCIAQDGPDVRRLLLAVGWELHGACTWEVPLTIRGVPAALCCPEKTALV